MNDIKNHIKTNTFAPLRNATFFIVINFIFVGLSAAFTIVVAALSQMARDIAGGIPFVGGFVDSFLPSLASSIISLGISVGTIMCIIVLMQFNNSLKGSAVASGSPATPIAPGVAPPATPFAPGAAPTAPFASGGAPAAPRPAGARTFDTAAAPRDTRNRWHNRIEGYVCRAEHTYGSRR